MAKEKLTVYFAPWCGHCRMALCYLEELEIDYEAVDIETADDATVAAVDAANGGGWVVPTLEYAGRWVPGRPFEMQRFADDLRFLGLL